MGKILALPNGAAETAEIELSLFFLLKTNRYYHPYVLGNFCFTSTACPGELAQQTEREAWRFGRNLGLGVALSGAN